MTYQKQQEFIVKAAKMAQAHESNNRTPWLNSYRHLQQQQLAQAQFPNASIEHFKYNCFDIFAQQDLCQAIATHHKIGTIKLTNNFADDANSIDRIVFVDGKYNADMSHIQHHYVTRFCDANVNQQEKIINMLTKQHVEHNPFIMLNAALSNNGVLIEIGNANADTVIEIVNINTPNAHNTTTATQVLFDIATNAKATAIEHSINISDASKQATLSTLRTIANIGEKASFTHYQLQLEDANTIHFGSTEYNLHSSSKLKLFCAATGSALKKMDIVVNHLGQHTQAELNGLYAATDNQQVDYHTTVNHTVPNGTTDENFRAIINGNAEGVFNGRIHIYPNAQKTRAELSNKNLLLSDDGIMHTKPELEIYADDVICAHGATISRIDDASLYYLVARGITKAEAEVILSYAFFDEILSNLANQKVAQYIRPFLFSCFTHTKTS